MPNFNWSLAKITLQLILWLFFSADDRVGVLCLPAGYGLPNPPEFYCSEVPTCLFLFSKNSWGSCWEKQPHRWQISAQKQRLGLWEVVWLDFSHWVESSGLLCAGDTAGGLSHWTPQGILRVGGDWACWCIGQWVGSTRDGSRNRRGKWNAQAWQQKLPVPARPLPPANFYISIAGASSCSKKHGRLRHMT